MTGRSDDKALPRENLRPATDGVRMSCLSCGVTFRRSEAATPKKGQLACPVCGAVDITQIRGGSPRLESWEEADDAGHGPHSQPYRRPLSLCD